MDERVSPPEAAIADAVSRYQPALVRLARSHGVPDADVERTILAAWRSALAAHPPETDAFRRTLFREVIIGAGELEGRREPKPEPAVEPERFEVPGSRWEHWFTSDPPSFARLQEGGDAADRARVVADEALADIPFPLRVVVVLRDVAGWSGAETDGLLGIDAAHERALLHDGRARVRRAIERFIESLDG